MRLLPLILALGLLIYGAVKIPLISHLRIYWRIVFFFNFGLLGWAVVVDFLVNSCEMDINPLFQPVNPVGTYKGRARKMQVSSFYAIAFLSSLVSFLYFQFAFYAEDRIAMLGLLATFFVFLFNPVNVLFRHERFSFLQYFLTGK